MLFTGIPAGSMLFSVLHITRFYSIIIKAENIANALA